MNNPIFPESDNAAVSSFAEYGDTVNEVPTAQTSVSTPVSDDIIGNPFPRSATLEEYVKNSCPVEELPELLWQYLQHKYSEYDIGALNAHQEPVLRPGEDPDKAPKLSDVKEAVVRLKEMVPRLPELLRKKGIRRIIFHPDKRSESIKSGRYSYVVALGQGTDVTHGEDFDKEVANSGELLRISSRDEEHHWKEDNFPPMLFKPIEVLKKKPDNIAIYSEIGRRGINNRHIEFLDMVSTISGYLFDDFQTHNTGLLLVKDKNGGKHKWLPVVLDNGAIADHAHELEVLKDLIEEDDGKKLFARSNWGLFDMRTKNAGEGDFEKYPKISPFTKCTVGLISDVTGNNDKITAIIDPEKKLARDFREWFEMLGLAPEKIDDFDVEKDHQYYQFKRRGSQFVTFEGKTIPEMVKDHFGKMAIVAQGVNQKIHELYAHHKSFPETWPVQDWRDLEVYKMLRQEITSEIRQVIAPLYEQAQKNHVEAFGMKHGAVDGAITKKRLDTRNNIVKTHQGAKATSRTVKLYKKRPDVDSDMVQFAMQETSDDTTSPELNTWCEEQRVTKKHTVPEWKDLGPYNPATHIAQKNSEAYAKYSDNLPEPDAKTFKKLQSGSKNWMDRVEQDLDDKTRITGSSRRES